MDDVGGQAGDAAQATRLVQIAPQYTHALRVQRIRAIPGGAQGHELDTATQRAHDTHADIAATDDENALAAKARRQRSEWVLV